MIKIKNEWIKSEGFYSNSHCRRLIRLLHKWLESEFGRRWSHNSMSKFGLLGHLWQHRKKIMNQLYIMAFNTQDNKPVLPYLHITPSLRLLLILLRPRCGRSHPSFQSRLRWACALSLILVKDDQPTVTAKNRGALWLQATGNTWIQTHYVFPSLKALLSSI